MIDFENAAEGLVKLTRWWSAHDLWDCGMAMIIGPVFIEAYAARAAIMTEQALSLGRGWDVAHAFCDRAVLTQGVTEADMFYMGYANERNAEGTPNCSCVADASSTAMALLELVKAYPQSPKAAHYLASARRFADYVLDHYVNTAGGIGVGILGHQVNPMTDYWCADALFVEVLIAIGEITGESRYLDAAVGPLTSLATFDYRTATIPTWQECPTEIVFYAGEGILAGLCSEAMRSRLQAASAPEPVPTATGAAPEATLPALNRIQAAEHRALQEDASEDSLNMRLLRRWQEFTDFLFRHQYATGIWEEARDYRAYQLGLPWLFTRAIQGLGQSEQLDVMINRQMAGMLGPHGTGYFGLYCRPFASALAHLSFAAVAKACERVDAERFAEVLTRAQREIEVLW